MNTNKTLLLLAIFSVFTISSCCSDCSKPDDEETAAVTEEICFYAYDEAAGAQVRWTAFKTTAKKPVGGQFDEVNVTVGEKSTKITDLLETIKFNIKTSSVNSANEDRDAKLVASFFGAMTETDLILGQVKSVEGDNKSGACVFYLTLNNVEKEVTLNYVVTDNNVMLTGELDLLAFSAEGAVASLNTVCGDLHKGDDGVSKTWNIVELEIETTLKKECH